jgi:hypothetical protein
LFDVHGRLVGQQMVQRGAGRQILDVSARDLRSGVYYYELDLGENRHRGRLVVVK